MEEPREDAENHEVDRQAIVLQELLAEEEEEQRKETNYEDMAEKILAELWCFEEPARLLTRWAVASSINLIYRLSFFYFLIIVL